MIGITLTGVSGGTTNEYYDIVDVYDDTIIGFSLSGQTIPEGEGVLFTANFKRK